MTHSLPPLLLPEEAKGRPNPTLCGMPDEVLGNIFGHMLTMHIHKQRNAPFRGQPFGLWSPGWRELQVCRRIWSAAVRTPELWSLIALGIPNHGPERGSDWTDLCMARTGDYLITLSTLLYFLSSCHDKRFDDLAPRTHALDLAVQVEWGGGLEYAIPVDTYAKLPPLPCLKYLVMHSGHLMNLATFHQWLSHSPQLVSLNLSFKYYPLPLDNLQPVDLPHLRSLHLRGHPSALILVLQLLPDPHEALCIHSEYRRHDPGAETAKTEQRRLLGTVLGYWDRQIQPQSSRSQYALVIDCRTGMGNHNVSEYRFHPIGAPLSTMPRRLSVCSTVGDLDFIRSFGRIAEIVCVYADAGGHLSSSVFPSLNTMTENVGPDWVISAVLFAPWTTSWSQSLGMYTIENLLEDMKDRGKPCHALIIDAPELNSEESRLAEWINTGLIQEIRKGVSFLHEED